MFKGRISSKWAQAQDLYYRDNPDTRDSKYFNGNLWASKVIGKLIEISLDLWDTRNKVLHGHTLEEQNRVQRVKTIKLVTEKYNEGASLKDTFPDLFREPCLTLCDKPTLQLKKWVDTYNIYRGFVLKKYTKKRRQLLRGIHEAYITKVHLSQYN